METAVISYRVADFLKKYPPFNAIEEGELLALAARGRVRFHEPHEYILWQGEPHRHQIFVIQQGTVSLWDDTGGRSQLRDVRGAGDLLGIERYNGASQSLHSVRSQTDVVIYAFPADDFSAHVLKYPHAAQYVEAEGHVTPDYQGGASRRAPHHTFLHSIVGQRPMSTCRLSDTVAEAASRMLAARSNAVAVLGADDRVRGTLTGETLLGWISAGAGDASQQTLEALLQQNPVVVGPDALVTDGVLAMGGAGEETLAITSDGTTNGAFQALVTSADLGRFFGEQPSALFRDIRASRTLGELREINQRIGALTLEYLTGAAAVEWLARLTSQLDAAIVTRILTIVEDGSASACWCFAGSSGRGELLTRFAPHLAVILGNDGDTRAAGETYRRVVEAFAECGYLPRTLAFDGSFYVACVDEWKARYRDWIRDPVIQQMYRARTLFDLRPVRGRRELWDEVDAAVTGAIDRDFLHVIANDCLASLPPLTFYEDAVVDNTGEQISTFRLEESALRPLVDVGRVFGMAGGAVLGRSTLERLGTARTLLPEHEEIFREAADTLRVVLWQQGRVGISQGTTGAELPPALLSRHDRHVLKSGFRSILRLIQFTADPDWLQTL